MTLEATKESARAEMFTLEMWKIALWVFRSFACRWRLLIEYIREPSG